jgi:hypothetical protein
MTDHQFIAGDRVYHRQRRQYGRYVEIVDNETSYIDLGDDQELASGLVDIRVSCVTTAQLVPAEEVTA